MRPSTRIVELLKLRVCDVFFTYKNQTVNARSLTNLLMLGVKKNAEIEVSIEGPDALETMTLLEQAFANGFGEQNESL
jgi:phosphocarrier protein HPr